LFPTEFQYEGDNESGTAVITKEIPHSPTELARLQEKYSRLPKESETEYVWRVSLTGGDRIKLNEDESQGYWGPGVVLTVDDTQAPWSLTQHVAYWAGGLNPLEWGKLVAIHTSGRDQFTESMQKVACLQLMHNRHLEHHQPSLMLLKADPDRTTPLIRGLPDPLKFYAVETQDRLRAVVTPGGMLREQLRVASASGVGGHKESALTESALTQGKIAQELITYSRRVG
ncbi:hypothetical protein N339_02605, partial [Pterocles gutturalis]